MWESTSEKGEKVNVIPTLEVLWGVVLILTYCLICHFSFDLLSFVLLLGCFLLHCQPSDHRTPGCLWVSVSNQGWPCQTLVSEVEFLLDWPGMPFMTSLSQIPGSKWQVFSSWDACGWTEESQGPAGYTVREKESRQVHGVTTIFNVVCPLYIINLYSLFHVLMVQLSTGNTFYMLQS